jgi:hypothetical protein
VFNFVDSSRLLAFIQDEKKQWLRTCWLFNTLTIAAMTIVNFKNKEARYITSLWVEKDFNHGNQYLTM